MRSLKSCASHAGGFEVLSSVMNDNGSQPPIYGCVPQIAVLRFGERTAEALVFLETQLEEVQEDWAEAGDGIALIPLNKTRDKVKKVNAFDLFNRCSRVMMHPLSKNEINGDSLWVEIALLVNLKKWLRAMDFESDSPRCKELYRQIFGEAYRILDSTVVDPVTFNSPVGVTYRDLSDDELMTFPPLIPEDCRSALEQTLNNRKELLMDDHNVEALTTEWKPSTRMRTFIGAAFGAVAFCTIVGSGVGYYFAYRKSTVKPEATSSPANATDYSSTPTITNATEATSLADLFKPGPGVMNYDLIKGRDCRWPEFPENASTSTECDNGSGQLTCGKYEGSPQPDCWRFGYPYAVTMHRAEEAVKQFTPHFSVCQKSCVSPEQAEELWQHRVVEELSTPEERTKLTGTLAERAAQVYARYNVSTCLNELTSKLNMCHCEIVKVICEVFRRRDGSVRLIALADMSYLRRITGLTVEWMYRLFNSGYPTEDFRVHHCQHECLLSADE